MRSIITGFTQALATLTLGLAWSCASTTPGARPQDASAAQHAAMAREEQGQAETHGAEYRPNAKATEQSCPDLLGSPACWSSSNPTKEHLERADEHRRRAAEHRGASRALVNAEASACAGLSARDRDESPFDHREDIASVRPLYIVREVDPDAYEPGVPAPERFAGATITLRAVPGMTAPWLQRLVDCHLARNAALGHDVPEMAYCPLVPKNVTARVGETPSGFAIEVRSDDPSAAREVLRRAEALQAH